MKKFFTLLTMLVAVFAINAQQTFTPSQTKVDKSEIVIGNHQLHAYTSLPAKKHIQHNSRNASTSVQLDYAGADGLVAAALGTSEYYVNFLDINKNYPNSTFGSHRWALSLFDSLIYTYTPVSTGVLTAGFLPRKTSTLTLDSFDIFFVHENTTGSPDTIHIQIFDRDSLKFVGNGNNASITYNNRWDTTIITTTTIPLNVNDGSGTPTWTALTCFPNLTFAKGKTFGYRVDFAGDTANKFNLTASFRDDCGQAELAAYSAANNPDQALYLPNSMYYINAQVTSGNYSGINSVGFNYPTCAEWYAQNWWIYPYVTDSVEFSAAIVADSLKGCPGTTILNLSAFGFGSEFTNATYAWSTTSGSISDPAGQTTQLTLDSTAVVTVVITDDFSQTVSASINVTSYKTNFRITDGNPITLACGGSTIIHTQVSGYTVGAETYLWNTGANTPNLAAVSTAGTYTATVTNSKKCVSPPVSVDVIYSGVSNTVNFTIPASPVCQNDTRLYTNTSSNLANWNSNWVMKVNESGNANDTLVTADANYAYSSPGQHTIRLTMDSSGCKFTSSHTVNVTPTQSNNPNGNCYVQGTGIEDINFSNAVSVVPNPTHGNVTINVTGVEKNISIKIYNVIGSEVKSFNSSDVSSAFSKTFDLSELSSGTYLVKIQTADKTAVKRLTLSK